MKVDVKKVTDNKFELTVTVMNEKFADHYQKTLNSLKKGVELPGFRPGFAPLNLIEEKYGEDKINQEVLRELVPYSYIQAVVEQKLKPIKDPEVEIVQVGKEKDLIFKATIITLPEVKIGNYQKIKVKKEEPKKITEREVTEALERLSRSQNQSQTESGFIYDAQGNKVELSSSGSKVPVGKPGAAEEDYDSLAKKVGFKDEGELKEKIKEELQGQENYEVEKRFEEKLFDELLKTSKVDIPEELVSDEVSRMLSNFSYQLQMNGMRLEDYLTHKSTTVESLQEEWRPQAEKNIKVELILRKIAEEEKITVSDQEVTSQMPKDHAHEHTPEELSKEENFVRSSLRQNKTLQVLKSLASK